MKHLFIVHSNITYLVSLRVIEALGLAEEEVVFGIHRNYEVPDTRFKNKFALPPNFLVTRNFIKNRQNINKWYSYIDNHVNSDYVAYVPHTFNLGLALLVTNNRCKYFNYIEEGLASYNPKCFKRINITWLRLWINTCIYTSRALVYFLFEHRFFSLTARKLNKCYAVSELAFTESDDRELLEFMPKVKREEGTYKCIVVFDALSIFGKIDSEVLLDLLQTVIIPHIKNTEAQNVAYKLHPEHYITEHGEKECIKIRDIMRDNFEYVVELDRMFNLEAYFSQYNVTVYTYVSSLGYYASLVGCASYRVAKRLVQINSNIKVLDEIENKLLQL